MYINLLTLKYNDIDHIITVIIMSTSYNNSIFRTGKQMAWYRMKRMNHDNERMHLFLLLLAQVFVC